MFLRQPKFHLPLSQATTFNYRNNKHFDVNTFVNGIARIFYHIIMLDMELTYNESIKIIAQ